jgi:hypothetical protein
VREHTPGDLAPIRELPYRPAVVRRRIIGRTRWQYPTSCSAAFEILLAPKGASTDGKRPSRRMPALNGAACRVTCMPMKIVRPLGLR